MFPRALTATSSLMPWHRCTKDSQERISEQIMWQAEIHLCTCCSCGALCKACRYNAKLCELLFWSSCIRKKNYTWEEIYYDINAFNFCSEKKESSQGDIPIQINLNLLMKDSWRVSDLTGVVQGKGMAESPSCFHVGFERHHWKLPSSVW